MKNTSRFLLTLLLLPGFSGGALALPKIYDDSRQGIAFARENKRLILFLLLEHFDDKSDQLEESIQKKLGQREKEFVIVRCRTASIANRKMFADRFKVDVEKAPLAVVADTEGKPVAIATGMEGREYDRMIEASRIKTGVEKDPERIAAIIEDLGPDGEKYLFDGTFGIKVKDVAAKRLLLSEYRVWIFKNGATMRAALLEAKGPTGVFIRQADQKRIEVKFSDLSANDTAFLTELLSKPGAGKPKGS